MFSVFVSLHYRYFGYFCHLSHASCVSVKTPGVNIKTQGRGKGAWFICQRGCKSNEIIFNLLPAIIFINHLPGCPTG